MSILETTAPAHTKLVFESVAQLQQHVGQPWVMSAPRRIDQATINAFGELTNDRQWIHVDPARAAVESPSGGTIAHGFLTLSLLTEWHFKCFDYSRCERVLNYGFDKIRFTAPVPSGALVFGAFQLREAREVDARERRCLWQVEVRVEGADRPAVVAEWLVQARF
jgi:acyl dehydratase